MCKRERCECERCEWVYNIERCEFEMCELDRCECEGVSEFISYRGVSVCCE